MEGCVEPQHSRAALCAGLPTPHWDDRRSPAIRGETCGSAKRRGREPRAERGSPTARRQRADAQRLDSGERLAAEEFSEIAVR